MASYNTMHQITLKFDNINFSPKLAQYQKCIIIKLFHLCYQILFLTEEITHVMSTYLLFDSLNRSEQQLLIYQKVGLNQNRLLQVRRPFFGRNVESQEQG